MELKIKDLIGLRIQQIWVNETKDLFILHAQDRALFTEKLIYMTFVGSCCSNCFAAHVSGYSHYSTILEAHELEWSRLSGNKDEGGVVDKMGISFKTDQGYLEFETRLEHNGYYAGDVLLSDSFPLDQYKSPWSFNGESFSELEDF